MSKSECFSDSAKQNSASSTTGVLYHYTVRYNTVQRYTIL